MGSFELRLDPSPRRSIEKLPLGAALAVAEFMMGTLCANPHRLGKPLQRELTGYHSARIGEYRIIYRIVDEAHIVHVVRIEHRSNAYRTR